MDSLPNELLVQLFARLSPADLLQVGKSCLRWHRILLDDVLWHKVFLETFESAPSHMSSLDIPMKWRTAFIHRIRQLRVWGANYDGTVAGSRALRQLGCYRFKDMEGIITANISPDNRSLVVVTKRGIVHGKLSSKRHLSRSVLYFEGEQDEAQVSSAVISENNCLILGYSTGSVKIFDDIPYSSVNVGFTFINLMKDASLDFSLPVSKILPSVDRKSVCILRRDMFPTSRIVLLNDFRSQDQAKVILEVDVNSSNAACSHNDCLFWNSGSVLYCQDPKGIISHLEIFPHTTSITHLLQFGKYIFCVSCGESHELVFVSSDIDSGLHVAAKVSLGNNTLVTSVSSTNDIIILGCSNGHVYRILQDSESLEGNIKVDRLNQRPFDTAIKCVHVTNLIVLVVCEDSIFIYDCLGLKLLQTFPIPGKSRRVIGQTDLDPVTGTCNVSVLRVDDRGQLLIQWGMQTLHYWNLGKTIKELKEEPSIKSPPRSRQQKQADIAVDMREDLDALEDASVEREALRTVRSQFTLEGMNEEEMLEYAQLLSLQEESRADVEVVNSEEDPDLALAIRLSLLDNV